MASSMLVTMRLAGAKPMLDTLSARGRRKAVSRLNSVVVKNGMLLKKTIQMKASGRPGPNVITGRYRGSWRVLFWAGRDGVMGASVFTMHPAAKRLEYGFVGIDSLGRSYAQPPFPHIRPAAAMVTPIYLKDLNEEMQAILEVKR